MLSLATIIVSYSESPGGNSSLVILASGTVTNTSVCASWRVLFITSSPVSLFLKSCSPQLMIISNLFPRSDSKDDCLRILLCDRRTKRKPLTLHFQEVLREFSLPSLRTLSLGTWFILRKTFYRSIVRPGTEITGFFFLIAYLPSPAPAFTYEGHWAFISTVPDGREMYMSHNSSDLDFIYQLGIRLSGKCLPLLQLLLFHLNFSLLRLPSGL